MNPVVNSVGWPPHCQTPRRSENADPMVQTPINSKHTEPLTITRQSKCAGLI